MGDVVFLTISIHAPREGCDWRQPVAFSVRSDFNPRTPRGVRRSGLTRWAISQVFQSTHPARGATVLALLREGRPVLISIHAPREGCDFMEVNRILMGLNISIHAPREGCDGTRRRAGTSCSTISIHAPREGCDLLLLTSGPPAPHFNPRTPRGVRPSAAAATASSTMVFQSTHPARGATSQPSTPAAPSQFQSTHPARGATVEPGGRR